MFLLFDIGGTKTRLALTKDRKTIVDQVIFDTPESFADGIQKILQYTKGKNLEAAGGGVTGTLSLERTELVRSPNLSGWVGKPIVTTLEKELGVPVFIENDAAIVGLGEAVYGAGAGYSIVMYATISTGVGGTRIVEGEIDEYAFGFEPGNEIIDMQHTLEELVSGASLEKRFGKKPKEIPQSDPVWDELAEKLAFGLHNSILHWSPDVVVLGGSMIVGDPYIDTMRVAEYLRKISKVFPKLPQIKKAELGAVGGLYGALAYLNKRVLPAKLN